MKKLISVLLSLLLLVALCACEDVQIGASSTTASSSQTTAASAPAAATTIENKEAGEISLNGSSASSQAGGVTVSGSVVTISSPGDYILTGTLDNGQIVVDTGEVKGDVKLTLNGVNITNPEGNAIDIRQAKNTTICLAAGTVNTVTSGAGSEVSPAADTASGAAIFSADDLKFTGEGNLTVTGFINNGITCKDDIVIKGGAITVEAANNGIRANESVTIHDGDISVTACNDGIKATSSKKEGKGFVLIDGGIVTVNSVGDGISAVTDLTIDGGNILVVTTGNTDQISSKALKATSSVNINGGELSLTATGKAISSHGDICINSGLLQIDSEDDGIATDTLITVNGGELTIRSGNDGFKAGAKGGTTGKVQISGGTLHIHALGDPVDAKGEFLLSGGSVFAFGNAGSVKKLSSDSQAVIVSAYGSQIAKGTSASITLSDGTVYSESSQVGFRLVLLSDGSFQKGDSAAVQVGSSNTTVSAK